MNIVIVNLIEINIIDEFLKRIFINEMLIDNFFQITKNALNSDIINFDKIKKNIKKSLKQRK